MVLDKQESSSPGNPTGKGGFGDNPQNINRLGRPKELSITERIKEILENDPKLFEKTVKEYMVDPKHRDLMWRMIDGNPKQQTDLTTNGKDLPIPILKLENVQRDISNNQDQEAD